MAAAFLIPSAKKKESVARIAERDIVVIRVAVNPNLAARSDPVTTPPTPVVAVRAAVAIVRPELIAISFEKFDASSLSSLCLSKHQCNVETLRIPRPFDFSSLFKFLLSSYE